MFKIINHKNNTSTIVDKEAFNILKQMLPSYCTYEEME